MKVHISKPQYEKLEKIVNKCTKNYFKIKIEKVTVNYFLSNNQIRSKNQKLLFKNTIL